MVDNNLKEGIPNESLALEKIANTSIASYGFKHKVQKNDKEETYRTEIRRQRDKILYTGGFRRLQDKTQVMSATLTGDHRTRLTHTLEVEQIAISVADALNLNKDLVSAISLGHDVGHTPFGHAAERTLNKLLENMGGFHHPIQSAKYLWEKHGNNIDDEIYEGILEHDSDMFTINKKKAEEQLGISKYVSKDNPNDSKKCVYFEKFLNKVPSTLEAQVVIWADKIAYITHDLEDFLGSSIYTSVVKSEGKSSTIESKICTILGGLMDKPPTSLADFETRNLIRNIITNLIITSAKNIGLINDLSQQMVQQETEKRLNKKEIDEKKRYLNSMIINFEDAYRISYYELRDLLDDYYIFSTIVQRSDAKAQIIVNGLYKNFTENYKLLPLEIRKKIDDELREVVKETMYKNNIPSEEITTIILKDVNVMEKQLKLIKDFNNDYDNKKAKIIARVVASYISTMSDTHAENIYCNLNASRDNYII